MQHSSPVALARPARANRIVCFSILLFVGMTVFQDLLQCDDFNTAFHPFLEIETELFLMTIPSILALSAVTVVSVYVLKLRIRLSREIQPRVNLPGATVNCIQIQRGDIEHSAETFQEIKNIGAKCVSQGEKRNRPNWNDIQIMDIENSNQEDLSNIKSSKKDPDVPEQESSFSVKRNNSDPSQFFRVPKEPKLPEVKNNPSCFSPLSLIVERILMINIAAFCVALNLTLSTSMRLFFSVKGKETYDRFRVLRTCVNLVDYFLIIMYVLVVRKKLFKN